MNEQQKNNILFVTSPTNANEAYPPFYYLYLAGFLEKHGIQSEISDHHFRLHEQNVDAILDDVKRLSPDFIGLAAFVTDYDVIIDLGRKIKEVWSGVLLVGNAHASIAPEDFIFPGSPFDIVVRGEGELTVLDLLTIKDFQTELSSVPGVAYLKDGEIHFTPPRGLMNLAECGMPAYHKLDMTWYAQPRKVLIRRIATVGAVIYISRGCPFQCTFCASNTVWNTNTRPTGCPVVRKRPMEHVIADLRILQDTYGFDFFYILDDTFGVLEKDIIDFCKAYRSSGLTMLWGAETRVRCLQDESIVALLHESGCIQLDFGVESGSQRLLDLIRKQTKVKEIIDAFNLCQQYSIRTFANILLNLPSETEADFELTHKLLKQIKPTYVSVGITQPYPGTQIHRRLKNRVLPDEYHEFSRLLPPEKFRLSAHKLDFQKLLFSWMFRYGIEGPVESSFFKVGWNYWKHIFHSKHRWQYVKYLLRENLLAPIRFVRATLRFFFSRWEKRDERLSR